MLILIDRFIEVELRIHLTSTGQCVVEAKQLVRLLVGDEKRYRKVLSDYVSHHHIVRLNVWCLTEDGVYELAKAPISNTKIARKFKTKSLYNQ
jgi:hypothetical protein